MYILTDDEFIKNDLKKMIKNKRLRYSDLEAISKKLQMYGYNLRLKKIRKNGYEDILIILEDGGFFNNIIKNIRKIYN